MKKVFALMLVSVFAFGMVACGDDDDDVDNVAACQDLQDTINGLDCYDGANVDLSCDSMDQYTCDISDYYGCVEECYGCDGDLPTFDTAKYSDECVPMASCD